MMELISFNVMDEEVSFFMITFFWITDIMERRCSLNTISNSEYGTIVVYWSRNSRMGQLKFVEDSL